MQARLSYTTVSPDALKALLEVEKYVEASGLEESLRDLVCMRASQINGCAFCLDMHAKDARASGETEQRLYGLSAWWEMPFYTERERAALAWTEAVTLVADSRVPDEVYEQARKQFTEKELVSLTMTVIAINSWNRVNVAFRTPAGHYRSSRQAHKEEQAVPHG